MRVEFISGLLFTMTVLLPAGGVLAEERGPGAEASDSRSEKREPRPERDAPAPSASFTPSDKIKADSSVSFPVDI